MRTCRRVRKIILPLIAGKLSGFVASVRGGGTALPGLVVESLNPRFMSNVTRPAKRIILVSGTNGKTTTSKLIVEMLRRSGYSVLHNTSGSNLRRGIISTLLPHLGITGRFRRAFDFAVFECDEFALNGVVEELDPDVVVLGNLFRDQLDRYGEVDTVRKRWKSFSGRPGLLVVANGDDPSIASVANGIGVFYFGVEVQGSGSGPKDVVFCPVCGSRLHYSFYSFSHLGDYRCSRCGFARPNPDVVVKMDSDGEYGIFINDKGFPLKTTLRGVYNLYNVSAAILVGAILGIDLGDMLDVVSAFKPAFGRQEVLRCCGKTVHVILVKNPIGFSQALGAYLDPQDKKNVVLLLNDGIADGTDVSWIWDADVSPLGYGVKRLFVGGRRAYDMGLRIKYAGMAGEMEFVLSKRDLFRAIRSVEGDEVYVFPTYTAMLSLKKYFSRLKGTRFWE